MLVVLLPLVGHGAAVRRDFYFEAIGAEQGLSQNTVNAFLQDRNGLIWLGTSNSLQQYNGYGFTTYEESGGRYGKAPEGPISSLAEDGQGNLWIGTSAFGLVKRSVSDGTFTHVTMADNAAPAGSMGIESLLFVAQQGLWVGGGAGLSLVDTASGRVLRTLPVASAGSRAAQIRQIARDDRGTVWLATSAGLFRLSDDAKTLERIGAGLIEDATALLVGHSSRVYVTGAGGLYRLATDGTPRKVWANAAGDPIGAIAEDARGRLWLAIPHHGLTILDPASGEARSIEPDHRFAGGLPDAMVRNLQIDRSGLLWIGTMERGLIKVDPDGAPFRYVVDHDPLRELAASNYILATHEDGAGRLWIGTMGDGLKRYDIATNTFDDFGDVIARASRGGTDVVQVTAIVDAPESKLWIGTNHGVALFDPERRSATFLPLDPSGAHGLPDGNTRSLLIARDGTMWIGTSRAGLVQYDPVADTWHSYRHDAGPGTSGGLSDDRVLALLEDRDGRIWAGSRTGLNLIDRARRSVRVFRSSSDDPHALSDDVVRSIHESADGALWVGTHRGLNRLDTLDAGGARFTHWLPRDGLPSGTVYAIEDDRSGRLWLSTNRGIGAFDRASGRFTSFSLANGLQGMEYNSGASVALRNGDLVFGGVSGFNLFSPQSIVGSRYAAPVVITDVRVGNGEQAVTQGASGVRMAMSDHVIRFDFAALDFTAPERNRFSYRLEGFDDSWIDAGDRHDATYTNLDAGQYTFHVRASNHDGYWNDQPATISLKVTPPWWQNPVALAAYLLIAALAVASWASAYRRRRNAELLHHHDLREREDRLRLALWGSGDDFWDWNIIRGEFVVTGASDLFKGSTARGPMVYPHTWFREHLHPDDVAPVERRLEQHFNRVTETFESEHRLRNHKGEWVWSLTRGKMVEYDEHGQPSRMCGTARDVTAERAAEHDRRIAQEVIRSMSEAVAVTDLEFRFLSVNPAFTKIAGWRNDEVAGRSAALLNCSQHPPEHYAALRESLKRSGHWRGELWQKRKEGEEFLSWSEISEVRDASGVRTHFVSVISDITDRKRTEQELRYLANYDALTGLPNRTLLSERIGHAIIRARRSGRRVAVLFLDLDRFKHVNDSMGHAAGDRMLKAAGSRLRHVVREGDSVARLGGDEFTVVLEDIDGSVEAERIAEKIISAF
ncbi:MAG: two-component regulator propeller domain-containing protein, partial [Dokdonella sp.]|uniref:two-component regulator propeller domain-containing protein n=1 Tax=Dokdonella sp. TaxID=2291710 RepID=UPI003263CE52